jgi:hypothetical protein
VSGNSSPENTVLLTFAEVVTPSDLEFCVFEEGGQEVLVVA